MKKEDDRDDRKKGQQEVQTLTNSYLMVDYNKSNGVLSRLYNYTDYNAFSKPTDDIDVSTGSITQSVSSIPSPIVGKYIHLPDGSVTLPGLAWASETNSGLYKIGSGNFGQSVSGTLVYDWNATRIYASSLSIRLGVDAEIFPVTSPIGREPITMRGSFDGGYRMAIQNTNTGTGAHADFAILGTSGNDAGFGVSGTGSTWGTSHGIAAGECYVATNNVSGSAGMPIVLSTKQSQPIRFVTAATERARVHSDGNVGINTTVPRRKLDILDTAASQIRLTYTDATVYSELETNSSGWLNFHPTGFQVRLNDSNSATNFIVVGNPNGTSTANACFYAQTNTTTSGDPFISFVISTINAYSLGIDNSVSGDPLVLSYAAAGSASLGTGNIFSITSGGLVTWTRSDAVTTPTHDLIQSSTGDAAIRYAIGSTNSYIEGIDNSDSDIWKVSYAASGSAVLGTNDRLTINTSGLVTVVQYMNVGTTTSAAAQGDFSAGATRKVFFDESTNEWTQSGGAEPLFTLSSSHASGKNWTMLSGGAVIGDAGSFVLRNVTDGRSSFVVQAAALANSIHITGTGVGIFTTGPGRALDVLHATNPQVRLTHTSGSVYVDLQADSSGILVLAPSGGGMETGGYLNVSSSGSLRFNGVVTMSRNAATGELTVATNGDNITLNPSGVVRTTGEIEIDGALNHDGSTVGFYGVAPVTRSSAYSTTNVTTDRSYDADSTTLAEIADVLGTLIADLQATGIIGA